jgi:predicted phosphodiesterase
MRSVSRVAALYDIHGNLPALRAVLDDVRKAGVDLVVVGGDVLPGPMGTASLEVLSALDVRTECILGNGDRIVLAEIAGGDISEVPEGYRGVIRWEAARVTPRHLEWISGWPLTCRVEVRGIGQVLFCHATPENDRDVFTRLTPEERLLPVFEDVGDALVVCGHTHMPFDRRIGATRVVNAGSVGMPFCRPPGAYWLLLGPDVELRRTDYDFARAAEQLRATGYPMVEGLAVRYVLDPPLEADTLRQYAQAELS